MPVSNVINVSTLLSGLRSRLMARQIHYNVYSFKNGDAVVSATVRGRRMTMQMMYLVKLSDDKQSIEIAGFGWSAIANNEDKAIARIVNDIRKYELKFNKFLN